MHRTLRTTLALALAGLGTLLVLTSPVVASNPSDPTPGPEVCYVGD